MSKTTVASPCGRKGWRERGRTRSTRWRALCWGRRGGGSMQAWHPRDCIFMLLTPGAVFQWRVLVRLPPVPQHSFIPRPLSATPYLPLPSRHTSLSPFSHRTPPAAIHRSTPAPAHLRGSSISSMSSSTHPSAQDGCPCHVQPSPLVPGGSSAPVYWAHSRPPPRPSQWVLRRAPSSRPSFSSSNTYSSSNTGTSTDPSTPHKSQSGSVRSPSMRFKTASPSLWSLPTDASHLFDPPGLGDCPIDQARCDPNTVFPEDPRESLDHIYAVSLASFFFQ